MWLYVLVSVIVITLFFKATPYYEVAIFMQWERTKSSVRIAITLLSGTIQQKFIDFLLLRICNERTEDISVLVVLKFK